MREPKNQMLGTMDPLPNAEVLSTVLLSKLRRALIFCFLVIQQNSSFYFCHRAYINFKDMTCPGGGGTQI